MLITGPTGTGKSSLAAAMAGTPRVIWLKLYRVEELPFAEYTPFHQMVVRADVVVFDGLDRFVPNTDEAREWEAEKLRQDNPAFDLFERMICGRKSSGRRTIVTSMLDRDTVSARYSVAVANAAFSGVQLALDPTYDRLAELAKRPPITYEPDENIPF